MEAIALLWKIQRIFTITRFDLYYNGKILKLWAGGVVIVPHSWYHQCTQLDTKTGWLINIFFKIFLSKIFKIFAGHITMIVNGKVLYDDVISDFVNTEDIRPLSLEGVEVM